MAKTHSPGFLNLVNEAKPRIRELSLKQLEQFKTQGDPFILIDVREDHEWSKGHIPGALHIGKGILERDIQSSVPERDKTLVLYCGGGYRSILAADNLQKMGYTNVYSLEGGWSAWQEAHGAS